MKKLITRSLSLFFPQGLQTYGQRAAALVTRWRCREETRIVGSSGGIDLGLLGLDRRLRLAALGRAGVGEDATSDEKFTVKADQDRQTDWQKF